MERRRLVTNETGRLMLLVMEMEGWDCWLRPGESVEIRAEVRSPAADFVLAEEPDGVTVWPDLDMGVIKVWQGDREVEIGHQRPAGWPDGDA
jgi:hypothetical protein